MSWVFDLTSIKYIGPYMHYFLNSFSRSGGPFINDEGFLFACKIHIMTEITNLIETMLE